MIEAKKKIQVMLIIKVIAIVLALALIAFVLINKIFFVDKKAGVSSKKVSQVDFNRIYSTTKPNEAGDILVVMYHGLNEAEGHPIWHRSEKQFREDLEYLYEKGYSLITLDQYLSGDIDLPEGRTPILLTFDDSFTSTYSLVKTENGLKVNPNSMIGILEEFKNKYPEFGYGGVLFAVESAFQGDGFTQMTSDGTLKQKLDLLLEMGYTIGNHTKDHPHFGGIKEATEIQKQIGFVNKLVYNNTTTHYEITSLAYPYGDLPKKENMSAIEKGSYDGLSYNMRVAFLAAPRYEYFYSPLNKEFNPYEINRMTGNSGAYGDLYWFIEFYEKNIERKYVSDGIYDRLSIPESFKEYVNEEKLTKFNVFYYNPSDYKLENNDK